MSRAQVRWVVFVVVLAVAGCRSSNTAEVYGTIKLNGKPIEKGSMSFIPAEGKAPTTGCGIKDGRYTAQVHPGLNKVAVSVPKVYATKKLYPDDPKSPEMPLSRESLPEKYSSILDPTLLELSVDVKPGSNEKDFDLKGE
jgi:hypothetical protein